MSGGNPYIGCSVSVTSKKGIRYVGILHTLDPKESKMTLIDVRMMGSEGRTDVEIPARSDVYPSVTFRGADVKEIDVIGSNEEVNKSDDVDVVESGKKEKVVQKEKAKEDVHPSKGKDEKATSANRNTERHTRRGPEMMFSKDFNFVEANARMDKLKLTEEDDIATNVAHSYVKNDFFDQLSCEDEEKKKDGGRGYYTNDFETFGSAALRGRGRGRGYRGRGRRGYRPRGRWRGNRGYRGRGQRRY